MSDSLERGRVLNPVEVEQAIREAAATLTEGVAVVTARLDVYRAAQRAYDLAYSNAYMHAERGDGTRPSIEDRKHLATIATAKEREAMDTAEVGWKYAERRAKAAELTLSAFQTISKSVNAMYGAAGHGEY